MQHGGFMKVAESRQVVLPHQDVGIPEERQSVGLRTHLVLQGLDQNTTQSGPRAAMFLLGILS